MYRFFLMFAFFATSLILSAQDQTHELGLRLTGLQDFDVIYKKQLAENIYKRHRVAFVNISFQKQVSEEQFSFGFNYAFGKEKRQPIAEKLAFVHGYEPFFGFSLNTANEFESNRFDYRLGLGYVLGFQYTFSDAFYLNLETIPSINGYFQTSSSRNGNTRNSYGINAGFNANAVALTLAYRFTTK